MKSALAFLFLVSSVLVSFASTQERAQAVEQPCARTFILVRHGEKTTADPADPEKLAGFDVEIAELIAQRLGRRATFVNIAFTSIDQSIERGDAEIGAADECRALPFLRDEAGINQLADVVRERRGGHAELVLHRADREALEPGAHQQAIDLQPDRAAERFELCGYYFDLHGNICAADLRRRQVVFRELRK